LITKLRNITYKKQICYNIYCKKNTKLKFLRFLFI